LQLVRVIGSRIEDRHEHEPLDGRFGGRRDQRSGAETIHGSRVRSPDAAEPADRADDGPRPGDGSLQSLWIGDVARCLVDLFRYRSVRAT